MAQRISRAKRTLHTSGATFELPASHELGDRVRRALAVVYLLYNEGYAASTGSRPDPHRPVRGGDPAGPPGPPAAARRPRGHGTARADAPPGRAAAGARHGIRRPGDPRRAGPQPLGPRPRRRGHRPARLDDRRRSRARRVPAAGRDRRGARPGAHGGRHRLAAGRSRCTACSSRWPRARSSRWRAPWPSPRPRARMPQHRCSTASNRAWATTSGARGQRPRRRAARRPRHRPPPLPRGRGPGDQPRRATPPDPPGSRASRSHQR